MGDKVVWKGLEVQIPGEKVYAPGTVQKGVISGHPLRGTGARKRVNVRIDELDREYCFEKAEVINWLVDKSKAEALLVTLVPAKRGRGTRSGSQSESSANPEASQQSPSSEPAENGDAGHAAPLRKIPEAENGELEDDKEVKEDISNMEDPPMDGEEAPEENLENEESPSRSVYEHIGRWVSSKLRRSKKQENEEPQGDVLVPQDAETDEEIIDDHELELAEARQNGDAVTPASRSRKSGFWGGMKEVFYTPFSSMKIRSRGISVVRGPDLDEPDALAARPHTIKSPKGLNWGMESSPHLRMVNDPVSDSEGSPAMIPPPRINQGANMQWLENQNNTAQDELVDAEGIVNSVALHNPKWGIVNVACVVALVAGWASIAYYGWWQGGGDL